MKPAAKLTLSGYACNLGNDIAYRRHSRQHLWKRSCVNGAEYILEDVEDSVHFDVL